jgi:hypothetical protein
VTVGGAGVAMIGRARMVRANGLEFGLLEAGTGPLALCLHGFPDSAHTWRHLLPELAEAGFHAVAPFLRGYAPTAVPDDGRYGIGALVADTVALHQSWMAMARPCSSATTGAPRRPTARPRSPRTGGGGS